jgi:hypothetical protein
MPETDGEQRAIGCAGWRKSRHSNPSGDCVQVAKLSDGQLAVRNSRHPAGAVLVFTPAEMSAFVRGAKDGEFDDLITSLPE